MSSPSEPQQNWRGREQFVGAASAVLWILAAVLLVVNTRTAPVPGSHLQLIGLALSMLTWGCLLLAQMQVLVRRRLGATTPTGRRLVLATRVLTGLALVAGIIGVVRAVTRPAPMPDTDPFWTFIFVAFLAITLGEVIYAVASLFARPNLHAERADAQPR